MREAVGQSGHDERRHGGRGQRNQHAYRPRTLTFYVLLAAGLFAFIETFPLLSPILLSFLLVIFISLAVNPLVARIRAFVGGRKIATICIASSVLLVLALTIVAFLGPTRSSISSLSDQLPEYWAKLQKPIVKLEQRAARSEAKLQAEVASETSQTNGASNQTNSAAQTNNPSISSNGTIAIAGTNPNPGPPPEGPGNARNHQASISKSRAPAAHDSGRETATGAVTPARPPASSGHSGLTQTLTAVAERFAAVAFNAAQIVVVLITVFFGVTFTLMNPRPVFGEMFALIPERHHPRALIIMQRIGQFLPHWALSTLIAMLVVGSLVFALMWPLLGFPSAVLLGLIAGVLEAIPYLGPLLSAVPAVLLSVSKGGLTPVWVMLAYLIVQLLENNVIAPHVMARGMKLHSVAVIFSMLLCVVAFGVLGVLAAAPLVGVAQILHEEIYRKRFLPSVTNSDLERLARSALGEATPATK